LFVIVILTALINFYVMNLHVFSIFFAVIKQPIKNINFQAC